MRLSQTQIDAIVQVFQHVFSHGELLLFGSRVDDQKKGGDIDLYIQPEELMPDLVMRKVKFLSMLKSKIGDQKIDLVLAPFAPRHLKREIRDKGVVLCRM